MPDFQAQMTNQNNYKLSFLLNNNNEIRESQVNFALNLLHLFLIDATKTQRSKNKNAFINTVITFTGHSMSALISPEGALIVVNYDFIEFSALSNDYDFWVTYRPPPLDGAPTERIINEFTRLRRYIQTLHFKGKFANSSEIPVDTVTSFFIGAIEHQLSSGIYTIPEIAVVGNFLPDSFETSLSLYFEEKETQEKVSMFVDNYTVQTLKPKKSSENEPEKIEMHRLLVTDELEITKFIDTAFDENQILSDYEKICETMDSLIVNS
jgi:hypothetical protein